MLALLALLPILASASPLKRATQQFITAQRDGLCLSVPLGATPANGTPVISRPCDPEASTWDISYGSGSVVLSGTGFCLDAGTNPGNNGALKLWQCYPSLYQQTWYLTNDQRIAITGGTQCLDEGTNGVQTYQCTTGNTNQIFFAVSPGNGVTASPSSTSSASSTATSTSASVTTTSAPPPSATGYNIVSEFYVGTCLKVATPGILANGVGVVQSACGSSSQVWSIAPGAGQVKVAGTNFCLDAFPNPHNNGLLQIWECNNNPQQNWFLTGDGRIAITGGTQCLDFGTGGAQTYQCTTGDTRQAFALSL